MADEHNDRVNAASAPEVDPMDVPPVDEPPVTLDVSGIRDDVDRLRHQRQAAVELAEQTLDELDDRP